MAIANIKYYQLLVTASAHVKCQIAQMCAKSEREGKRERAAGQQSEAGEGGSGK